MSILTYRSRRLRKSYNIRSIIEETYLSVNDLIQPIFIVEGSNRREKTSIPCIEKLSIDELIKEAHILRELNILAIAIFPIIEESKKSHNPKIAFDENALVPRAIKAIKKYIPDLIIVADIALDPYTISGHDGIIDKNNYVLNDKTVNVLVKQSLCYARAGVDIIAPSDMMDGRINAIRMALEKNKFTETIILSYSAKFSSNLYGPFRKTLKSKGPDKKKYQLNYANSNEAIRVAQYDIEQGADIIMVKPANFYLDIIAKIKSNLNFPTFAYQVSGEYVMIENTISSGIAKEKDIILESLLAIKRAGADAIITYYSKKIAKLMKNEGFN